VILDTVQGLQDVTLDEGDRIDGLTLSPRGSVHDFDLAFQLRYLKKLNKPGEVTIIGLPQVDFYPTLLHVVLLTTPIRTCNGPLPQS
jgi:hypothetical protein